MIASKIGILIKIMYLQVKFYFLPKNNQFQSLDDSHTANKDTKTLQYFLNILLKAQKEIR